MTYAYHFVGRARPLLTPLADRNACVDLWRRLRLVFPNTAACILMPNHFHVLSFSQKPEPTYWQLGVQLRAWTQRFYPNSPIWMPIPKATPIPNSHHLKRQIRYVHLNPCRAGLAKDPLQWEWSTHRDICGCTCEIWPNIPKLLQVFAIPTTQRHKLGEVIHRYISSDPSVSVSGTPTAQAPSTEDSISTNIAAILSAAAIARREQLTLRRSKLRNLAIHTSHALRLQPSPSELRIHSRTWINTRRYKKDALAIQTIMTVLNDVRCRPKITLQTEQRKVQSLNALRSENEK